MAIKNMLAHFISGFNRTVPERDGALLLKTLLKKSTNRDNVLCYYHLCTKTRFYCMRIFNVCRSFVDGGANTLKTGCQSVPDFPAITFKVHILT